ncbi:hypothetical protein GX888_01835 [Candidatus Dojkabacteria bacterium]|uniref:VTT domain-containing protein n=1 Tax=Candidatus Dojkabacteria bacterium TaxID=2099670 RepID=A0A847VD69_9BACT|nr:hypothetical protein [Candidatus Dojkabacteria bacterium]
MLNLIITKLIEWFIALRYWGIFISAVGLFPTEIVIAILASMEENNVYLISLVTALGEVVGGLPIFLLGSLFTDKNIYKWLDGKGKFLGVNKVRFDSSKNKLDKKKYLYVFLSRFVPWVRVAATLAAGFLRVNFFKFSFALFLGVFFNSLIIAYIGKLAAGNLSTIKKYMSIGDKWIIIIVFGYLLISISWKNRKRIISFLKKSLKKSQ